MCRQRSPTLVIGAVGAGHQLPVGIVAGEPALQVKLPDGSVVEGARHNIDYAIRKAQALVEVLGDLAHLSLHGSTLLQVSFHNHELFHLMQTTQTITNNQGNQGTANVITTFSN
jgi:hypothetical protein